MNEVNDLIRPRDANDMDGAAEVAPVDSSATTAIPAEQSTNQVARPSQIGRAISHLDSSLSSAISTCSFS